MHFRRFRKLDGSPLGGAHLQDVALDVGADLLVFRDHGCVAIVAFSAQPLQRRAGVIERSAEISHFLVSRAQQLELAPQRRQSQHEPG